MPADQDVILFAVGTPMGPRSSVFRIWSAPGKSDVYITSRVVRGEFKASLHQSGKWRIGFTSEHVAGPNPLIPPTKDRALLKWSRPTPFDNGVTNAFQIIVPATEVTNFSPPDTDEIIWVPRPGDDFETMFYVTFTSTTTRVTDWPGKRAMNTGLIGSFVLANGDTVWITTLDIPLRDSTTHVLKLRREQMREEIEKRGITAKPGELRSLAIGVENDVGFFAEVAIR